MIGGHRIRRGLALLLLGVSACGPRYDAIDVDWISGPRGADVSGRGFSVPEGRLVVFSVDAQSEAGRRNFQVFDRVALATEHPRAARIEQGLATGTWMLMGVAQGRTVLEVRINGELEDRIAVDVLEQEVSP